MTHDGFTNLHPLFVHAPLVLVPLAAVMALLEGWIKREGFGLAARLILGVAVVSTLFALGSGLWAASSVSPADAAKLVDQHRTNGIVLTAITGAAGIVGLLESLRPAKRWMRYLRAGLLIWATAGAVFAGYGGATLVYKHGVAVTAHGR